MKVLTPEPTFMSKMKAQIIADALNADVGDDCTYKVSELLCPDDIIRVTVQAFDEKGDYVGTF